MRIDELSTTQIAALKYADGRPGGYPPRRYTTWRGLEARGLVTFGRSPHNAWVATDEGRALLDTATRPGL